jgi:hypothetical protein
MIETSWEWLVANPGPTAGLLAIDLAAGAVLLRWGWLERLARRAVVRATIERDDQP